MVLRSLVLQRLTTALAVIVVLPAVGLAGDVTIDQPNRYPSPTVKQPADASMFDGYDWGENTLTGDWGGWRSQWAEQGVVFGIQYVSVMMQNTHGGFDTGFVGGGPLGINAPLKDTLGVGPMQKIDIEFFADNPGRWFFHCHNLYHMAAGMARVIEYAI